VLTRWIAAAVAFLLTAIGGVIVAGGSFTDYDTALDAFALVTIVAVLVAGVVYGAVEYAQTGGLASIGRQFDTRTIVLIPIAIAINIILGQTVAAVLKVPIYLDSIGTILVGALAGPVPGILTGLSANLLWTYVLPAPFHSDFAAPFAIVAAAIGLLAGIAGRAGFLRPRPNRGAGELIVAGVVALLVIGGLATYTYLNFYEETFTFFNPEPASDPGFLLVAISWVVAILVIGAVVGFLALLFIRRDATVAWVVVAGAVTGVVAGLASAPIAANLFGGVTGAGTDFLVLFFRQQGSDVLSASFQQSLISDPIDKVTTFLLVYLILAAMARRTKARFPQGERLIEGGAGADEDEMQGVPA
jgi:hypothetical protein